MASPNIRGSQDRYCAEKAVCLTETSPEGTLFELAINGLTDRQGTARMGGIGANQGKICGSRHQRRTSLAEPFCGGIMAVGKGAESR